MTGDCVGQNIRDEEKIHSGESLPTDLMNRFTFYQPVKERAR